MNKNKQNSRINELEKVINEENQPASDNKVWIVIDTEVLPLFINDKGVSNICFINPKLRLTIFYKEEIPAQFMDYNDAVEFAKKQKEINRLNKIKDLKEEIEWLEGNQ